MNRKLKPKRDVYTRLQVYNLPLLTGCGWDPRTNGKGPRDAFLFEDSAVGSYMTNDNTTYMPSQETLGHNNAFLFPWAKSSEVSGKNNWKLPDLSRPLAEREAEAMAGLFTHMGEMHRLEVRSCHSTRTNRSTSTLILRMSKFNRYDLYNGHSLTVAYQYLLEKYEPTYLFLALGIPLDQIIPLIKLAAGPHWYDELSGFALNG